MSKKTSPLADLIDIASLLPWYIGLILAALSYFVLHHYAGVEISAPHGGAQMPEYFSRSLWKTLAYFFQFVLPFAFLIGALASVIRVKKRKKLYATAQSGQGAAVLNGMAWKEFEVLVGEAFRRKGFSVRENFENGPDGGVDLVLFDGSDKYLVQCKQWRAFKVGVKVVRELFGVMASTGSVGGFVVTSGEFTKDAKDFAQDKNINLIAGPELWEMIQSAKTVSPVVKCKQNGTSVKICPGCGKEMLLRIARRGSQAGQKFWGCTGYPLCKNTLPIEP